MFVARSSGQRVFEAALAAIVVGVPAVLVVAQFSDDPALKYLDRSTESITTKPLAVRRSHLDFEWFHSA